MPRCLSYPVLSGIVLDRINRIDRIKSVGERNHFPANLLYFASIKVDDILAVASI